MLVGLVAWALLRAFVEMKPPAPTTAGPTGVALQVAILVAIAGSIVALIDVRWFRESTLLENLGIRRGMPSLLTFALALGGEVVLRVSGLVR